MGGPSGWSPRGTSIGLAGANDDVRSHQVKEVMETDLHVASLNDDTADLAAVMTQFRIRHLPVVDESGRLLARQHRRRRQGPLDTLTDERDHLINHVQGGVTTGN